MKIFFTLEASYEVVNKLNIVSEYENDISSFFDIRSYSKDLETLYIALFCMSPQFESFFKVRKSKYTEFKREYIYKGVALEKGPKTYEYELRLEYQKYVDNENVKYLLAHDIIDSVIDIVKCKKIKNLDLASLQKDFRGFFHLIKWI